MNELLLKFKKKGFSGSLKIVIGKCIRLLNSVAIRAARVFPIQQDLILLESEGDCCDNAFALFRKMRECRVTETHHIVWLVEHPENYTDEEHVKYVHKENDHFSFRRTMYLATCRYSIYDHYDVLENLAPRKGQKRIYLSHGCGFKAPSSDPHQNPVDEVYATGKLYYESLRKWCGCREEALLDIGYPRLDYYFEPLGEMQEKFKKEYGFDQYSKVILWMPTFRKSNNPALNEAYFTSYTGLPILETEEQLLKFNQLLKEENALCVFKVHHLQAALPTFSKPFSNILVLNDSIITQSNLQLYQIVMLTDVLVTDYSSVSNDYMPLRKPIIYTIDDYESYQKSRGFNLPDIKQYLIGYQVETQDSFFDAIHECVHAEIDPYQAKRDKMMPLMHTYNDGNASMRIIKHLNLI